MVAKKSFTDKNFIAILALGVMILAVFLATAMVEAPTQTVSRAAPVGGY